MGQTPSQPSPHDNKQLQSATFFCEVYIDDKKNTRVDPDYFFDIDNNSWDYINQLMEKHVIENLKLNLKYDTLGCGYGGDEGNGRVDLESDKKFTKIPSMFFTVNKVQNDFEYNLVDKSYNKNKYRMDFFLKKEDDEEYKDE